MEAILDLMIMLAVVVNKENNMLGTRVFGPIAREIRDRGYLKIASLAKEVW